LPYEGVASYGSRHSSAFSNERNEWIELNRAAWSWLRFRVPEAVLPLTIEEAVLTVQAEAASRTFEVFSPQDDGELQLVAQQVDPSGVFRLSLTPVSALAVDDWGGLILGFQVGDQTSSIGGEEVVLPWKIEHVQLEIQGVRK
jgi:hypothetical protein